MENESIILEKVHLVYEVNRGIYTIIKYIVPNTKRGILNFSLPVKGRLIKFDEEGSNLIITFKSRTSYFNDSKRVIVCMHICREDEYPTGSFVEKLKHLGQEIRCGYNINMYLNELDKNSVEEITSILVEPVEVDLGLIKIEAYNFVKCPRCSCSIEFAPNIMSRIVEKPQTMESSFYIHYTNVICCPTCNNIFTVKNKENKVFSTWES